MKTCPQCGQTYDDGTNFCLTDGLTLVDASTAPTIAQIEIPTVVHSAPAALTIEQTAAQPFRQPFPQPFEAPAQVPAGSSPGGGNGVVLLLGGIALLAVLGVGIGLGLYFLSGPSMDPTDSVDSSKTDSGAVATGKTDDQNDDKRDSLDEEKEKLRADKQKLDEEKKRLEEERRELEAKKKMTPLPTEPPVDGSRTAYIVDPPSNVRATPNGRIVCVIRGLHTPVRILGSTGVRDSNGLWYFTDACGTRGVIHSTQIRF